MSNENMPIILDESFAYYDEERLENILKYINTEFNNNQRSTNHLYMNGLSVFQFTLRIVPELINMCLKKIFFIKLCI